VELTATEVRILGCLIEKQRTTPDQYPLSSNALRTACNQKTSRDPLVAFDGRTIDSTMLELRQAGLARTITGGRTNKHKQVLDEAWGLDDAELSVLGVIMLRGPQTVPELLSRTDRLHVFEGFDQIRAVLSSLADRPEPFVTNIGRAPGQREDRWAHLLDSENFDAESVTAAAAQTDRESTTDQRPSAAPPTPTSFIRSASAPDPSSSFDSASAPTATRPANPASDDGAALAALETEVSDLRRELAELRQRFNQLCQSLGEDI